MFTSPLRVTVLAAVAALCGPACGAAATRRTHYAGSTAQGIPVALTRADGGRWRFHYRARLRCSDGSSFLDRYFTDSVRLRSGRFTSRYSSDHRAVLTSASGAVGTRQASGMLRIAERYSEIPDAHGDTPLDPNGAIVCDSGMVRWRAARASGSPRVSGSPTIGYTPSPDMPIP